MLNLVNLVNLYTQSLTYIEINDDGNDAVVTIHVHLRSRVDQISINLEGLAGLEKDAMIADGSIVLE